ncbi:hypothetical protein AURDEDRAFT_167441 [Auricularia subglabra TFB-10046 SS5]|nr:hypothetical protein AURDEDRAFT_167441 [Auricularia subglabra TFB-10046 SS5]
MQTVARRLARRPIIAPAKFIEDALSPCPPEEWCRGSRSERSGRIGPDVSEEEAWSTQCLTAARGSFAASAYEPSSPDAGGGRSRLVSPGADAAHTEANSEATPVAPSPQTQTAGTSGAPHAGTPAADPTAPQSQVHASIQTAQHTQAQVHGAATATAIPAAGPAAPPVGTGAPQVAHPGITINLAYVNQTQVPPGQPLPVGTKVVRCGYPGCGMYFAGNRRVAGSLEHFVCTHYPITAVAQTMALPWLSEYNVAGPAAPPGPPPPAPPGPPPAAPPGPPPQ